MNTSPLLLKQKEINFWNYPWHGLRYFLSERALWGKVLILMVLFWSTLLTIFLCVWHWQMPAQELVWQAYLWCAFKALSYAVAAVLLTFVFIFPLLQSLMFESLLRRIFAKEGIPFVEVPLLLSIKQSMHMLSKTWGRRLLIPIFGFASTLLLGPVGLVISQIGISYLACLDGCDCVLSLSGFDAAQRIHLLKRHQKELFAGAFSGGALSIVLAFTFLGWLIWLPSIFIGSALRIQRWEDLTQKSVQTQIDVPRRDSIL